MLSYVFQDVFHVINEQLTANFQIWPSFPQTVLCMCGNDKKPWKNHILFFCGLILYSAELPLHAAVQLPYV